MIQGSARSSRSSQTSRQRSPTASGSGGRELNPNMVEAHSRFSVIRQPPI